MLVLSRESFEEYCRLVDSCEQRAVRGFQHDALAMARGFANAETEADRAAFRDAIASEVYGRIDLYRAEAQVRADDLFEAMTGMGPAPHGAYPYEAAERRVRSAAMHVFEYGDLDGFLRVLESFIAREVRSAANQAVAQNVERANG